MYIAQKQLLHHLPKEVVDIIEQYLPTAQTELEMYFPKEIAHLITTYAEPISEQENQANLTAFITVTTLMLLTILVYKVCKRTT
jgi:hypothetical protein